MEREIDLPSSDDNNIGKIDHYITTDTWTIKDELNATIYASALIQFMIHKETKPPLSISIQAPWGAGKTSLMRMVQNELDQDEYEYSISDQPQGTIRLGELVGSLWKKIEEKKQEIVISEIKSGLNARPKLTIWFNPWKYENSQQQFLWGGLADSIARSIINRMKPMDRKILSLKLNLKLLDINRILNSIKEIRLTYFWKKVRRPIISYGIGIAISVAFMFLAPLSNVFSVFGDRVFDRYLEILLPAIGFFGLISLVTVLVSTMLRTRASLQSESIDTILDQYVKEPSNFNLDNLRLILTAIPDQYKPIVIFIDDLDRCSPNTVLQVIEGINVLFTERYPSIFVIAMDAEVVAAALEVAHKEILSKLPKYSTHSPLGWRFMDKFIQLPLMIPPFGEDSVRKYVYSMLQGNQEENAVNNSENTISQNRGSPSNSISNEGPLTPAVIAAAASEFSANPRDIKRFVNVLRFYHFLRRETIRSNYHSYQAIPSMDQIKRWIILLLRWPSLIRWLYWSPGGKMIFEFRSDGDHAQQKTNPVCTRLRELERIAKISKDRGDWEGNIKAVIHTQDSNNMDISHLTDENLKYFFELENEKDAQDRVSAGSGQGVY